MNQAKRFEAVGMLRRFLNHYLCTDDDRDLHEKTGSEAIRLLKKKHGEDWIHKVQAHFTFGKNIRNMLRENGFSEKDLEVENLDDYYIQMLEEASGCA